MMTLMLDHPPVWPDLLRPLNDALLALGRLQQGLVTTRLHGAFLWRENVRIACQIAQISSYRMTFEQLAFDLLGVPPDDGDDVGGLAAGRRHFLTASRLFIRGQEADSILPSNVLWAPLWHSGGEPPPSDHDAPGGGGRSEANDGEGEGGSDLDRARIIATELAGTATRMSGVPLVTMLQGLRQGVVRALPRPMARLVLPLALHEAGLVPKPVPALIGGRLALGEVGLAGTAADTTSWLRRALVGLAQEADGAAKRLDKLTREIRAWQDLLAKEKLRRHAQTPGVLALLAATPVLTASLVVRHVKISKPAASKILTRLVELGILIEPIARDRFKVFVAADIGEKVVAGDQEGGLTFSVGLPGIDHEAIEANLDQLFSDLEQKSKRALARARAGCVTTSGA